MTELINPNDPNLSLTGRLPTYSESVDPFRQRDQREREISINETCQVCTNTANISQVSRSHNHRRSYRERTSQRSYGTIGRVESERNDRDRREVPIVIAEENLIANREHLLLMTSATLAQPPVKEFKNTILSCHKNIFLCLATLFCPCYIISLINFRLKHPKRAILLGSCFFLFLFILIFTIIYHYFSDNFSQNNKKINQQTGEITQSGFQNLEDYYQNLIIILEVFSLFLLLGIIFYTRLQTRNKLGYRDDYGSDFSTLFCCTCCVVCQMGQELRVDPRKILGPDVPMC